MATRDDHRLGWRLEEGKRWWLGRRLRGFPWLHVGVGLLGNLLFFIGSIMFLSEHWMIFGTWLFIIGSFGMLVGSIGEILVRIDKRHVGIE